MSLKSFDIDSDVVVNTPKVFTIFSDARIGTPSEIIMGSDATIAEPKTLLIASDARMAGQFTITSDAVIPHDKCPNSVECCPDNPFEYQIEGF